MNIVGAGLSGLIAAHIWPNAQVYEIAKAPLEQHKALLRFRSDTVAQTTGIEFKRVKVRKGIWFQDRFVKPSIQIANMYSKKCLRRIEPERSIWNIEPCERYIAPDNLYEQLIDNCESRIHWGYDYDFKMKDVEPVISTIPLPVLMNKLSYLEEWPGFNRSSITVQRFRLDGVEAYQTIYFPDPWLPVYRASITGDLLIIECIDTPSQQAIDAVESAFSIYLNPFAATDLGIVDQQYGKIVPIDDAVRKSLLFKFTHEHNIYSLGRFATWKNILLDDVVGDAAVIKRLMRGHHYDVLKGMV